MIQAQVLAQQGNALGKSAWFNGTQGDGIYAAPHSAYQFTASSDYSVEFWVRGDASQQSSSTQVNLVGLGGSGSSNDYPIMVRFYQATPGIWYLSCFAQYGGSVQFFEGPTSTNLLDNQAHHIAVTKNGNALTLYVDGTSVATQTNTLTSSATANLGIAISYNPYYGSPSNHFRGAIDEVKIFSTARTQAQIQAEKSIPATGNEAGLVFYLGMENASGEGSGKTLTNGATVSSSVSVTTLTPSSAVANDFTPSFSSMDCPALPSGGVSVSPSSASFQATGLGLLPSTSYDWKVVAAGAGTGATALASGTATSSGTVSSYYYPLSINSASVLSAQTNYELYIKNSCTSSWGAAFPFTTTSPCNVVVSNLASSNLMGTSASLSWGGTGAAAYEWKVVAAGAGVNATAVASGTAATTSANTTGLSAFTGYDFYVRAAGSCTNASWSAPQSFFTNGNVTPSFTASQNTNDAYIDLNWALPISPCFTNASGALYNQGVQLVVTDVSTNQIVYQNPQTLLSNNVLAPIPTFSQVATSNATAYTIPNTTGVWQNSFTAWTIEGWVKVDAGISNASIFNCTNSGSNVLNLSITGTNLILQKGATTHTLFNNLKYGFWTHIAVTYQNGTSTTYINGVQQNVNDNIGLMSLNGTYTAMSNFANGQIGDFRVWNRVRSATEIAGGVLTTAFAGANQNNLLLHWRWTTANTAPTDLATTFDGSSNDGQINGGSTANTAAYIATPQYLPITGTFRHWVGVSKSKNYQLSLYQIGNGIATNSCSQYSATGSTLAFQAPTNVVATDNQLHRVTLTWKNKSKLSESFRIKRSTTVAPITTKVLAVIPGTQLIDSTFTYQDVYSAADTNSIVSGINYSYCVETYNATFQQAYTQVCDNGKTNLISFTATDNAFADRVNLSWASMAAYNYVLNIKRDGVVIATLNKTQTTYTDLQPVFGKVHSYALALADATTGDDVIEAFNNGSVAAKGSISGKVLTAEGFAVKNARVILTRNIEAKQDTVYTNYEGNFAFNNLYYSTTAEFTLTPSFLNHTFSNAPYQVTLNNTTPAVSDIILQDATGFSTGTLSASLANFQVTPVTGRDKLNLTWAYTNPSTDTIFFNIYRGNVLIKSLNGTGTTVSNFQDSTGIPNASYPYKLVAYKYQAGAVNSANVQATVSFPVVTVPSAFTATVVTATGLANLTWTHSSLNYEGFAVFRNGTKIADLAKGTLSYQDKEAAPGASTTYSIKAKRKVENITHESVAATAAALTFPTLAPITALTATANTLRNSVQLSWTIPASLTATYNFDGFRVYRNNVYIGEVAKRNITPTYVLPFEDRTGIPNTAYTYVVKTFRKNFDGTLYESGGVSKSATYPVVSAPTTMVAFNTGQVGQVSFSWTPAAGINNTSAQNVNGQVIIRIPSDTLATLPAVVNNYTAFTNTTTSATYAVRTFRVVNGIRYFSTAVQLAGAPVAGSTNPVLPTAFKASTTYPNHVRLSWTYPDYIFSIFKIYRDNVLIATLDKEERFYYDYGATKGARHSYQVEAVNGANVAQKVGTWGSLRPIAQLNGVVTSQTTKNGIPRVDVTAFVGSHFLARTQTDSAGFYQFANLPAQTNQLVTVKAEVANHSFVTSAVNLPIGNPIVYNANFTSTYSPTLIDTVTVSSIAHPTATADYGKKRVILNWESTNSNYDGFEVYRTTTLLGVVTSANIMQLSDSLAQPGGIYNYSIKAYKETNIGRRYGTIQGVTTMYPIIEPVKELTLTAKPTLNQVNINWSHGWSNHSYYTIERNGVRIAKVKMDSVLQWNDKTGLPGQTYTYRVTAVQEVNGDAHTSEGVSQTINFPAISEVINLAANVPSATLPAIAAPCNATYTRTRNHVRLTWAYPAPTTALAGYNIYRNGVLIAEKVHKDSTAYNDYKGTFGVANQNYKVAAVTKPESTEYISAGITVTTTFPELSAPHTVTVTDSLSAIKLAWKYDEAVISGFYVLRGTNSGNVAVYDTVVVDTFKTASYNYLDKNGVPNQTYLYWVKAYSKRDGVELQSQNYTCLPSRVYPSPAAPTSLAGSDGTFESYVKVTWNYDIAANVQGFEIYRDALPIAKVEKGQRTYLDYQAGTKGNYTVKAYRLISNQYYYSAASNADDGNPGTSSILVVGQNSNVFERFGGALAANDSLVVVGAPGKGANTMGLVKAFRFNSTTNNWAEGSFWQPGYNGAKTGGSLAINNATQVLIGEPNWLGNGFNGFGYIMSVDATNTINTPSGFYGTPTSTPTSNFGYACAFAGGKKYFSSYNNNVKKVYETSTSPLTTEVTALANSGSALAGDNYMLFSGNKDGNEVKVTAVVSSGTYNGGYFSSVFSPGFAGTLSPALTTGSEYGAAIGVSINTGGAADKVFIGAPKQANKGAAYLWTGNPINIPNAYYYNTFNSPVYFANPNNAANAINDKFGAALDVRGDMAAIGASGFDGGKGAVYLYSIINGVWTNVGKIHYPNSGNDSLGVTVKLSKTHLLVGAPNARGGAGIVYQFPLKGLLTNVNATDNQQNSTDISWKYWGNKADISGFRIYANGVKIKDMGVDDEVYNYQDGIAGKHYIFEVAAYKSAGNIEYRRYADEGWEKCDGALEGDVKSLPGGAPIKDVNITATATIDGDYYQYTAQTGTNGKFQINGAYYGDNTATYSLKATYKDHKFQTNPITGDLSSSVKSKTSLNFYDLSVYVIKGRVAYQNTNKGIDSLQVTAKYILTNGQSQLIDQKTTDKQGYYGFTIDPHKENLERIEVSVDTMKQLMKNNNTDTLYCRFASAIQNVTNFVNFPQAYTLDFSEITTYNVPLKVLTGCENPVIGGKFQFRVQEKEGKLDKIATTNLNGIVYATLPPLEYNINVDGVENGGFENQLVVDFLRYRPRSLDLAMLHRKNHNKISKDSIEKLSTTNFFYHKPATISITAGVRYMCDQTDKPIIIKSGEEAVAQIRVEQTHSNSACVVKGGYLRITNAASDNKKPKFVKINATGRTNYFFKAGAPNLISPYTYLLEIVCVADTVKQELLGTYTHAVLVLGTGSVPGSDIIVNPGAGTTKEVPLPLFVLRDPPGDGSFTTIKKGTTIKRSITDANSNEYSLGYSAKVEGAAIWIFGEVEFKLTPTKTTEWGSTWEVKATTTQDISTSGAPGFVGEYTGIVGGSFQFIIMISSLIMGTITDK
ncbi:MAG: LamG-like jellyroll fold domain-containing protein, partial [Bacteroidia bacterium]